MATTCTVCDKPARAKGMCWTHYQRTRRGGDLDAPVRDRDRPVVATRVARETKAALTAEAKRRAIPIYRLAAEILDGWASKR